MARLRRRPTVPEPGPVRAHHHALVEGLTFEIVPVGGVEAAIDALPAGARVSVTCSPVKGLGATQRVVEQLVERGFHAIPHLSARLVADRDHTRALSGWCRAVGVGEVFVVAGDAGSSAAYPDSLSFLRDLLHTRHPPTTIGVPGYPDGHPFLGADILHEVLHEKQELLGRAGIEGYVATQMCFDGARVRTWLSAERKAGLALPVHLGLPGVVDRRRLVTLGLRLGVGSSLRFVRKNRAAVARMLTTAAYDPDELLVPLSGSLHEQGVEGLHVFTFNQVEATERWRRAHLNWALRRSAASATSRPRSWVRSGSGNR